MAKSSVIAEPEAIVSEIENHGLKLWPGRAILAVTTVIFIALLAVGYIWFVRPGKPSTDKIAARLKVQGLGLYREREYTAAAKKLDRYMVSRPGDWRTREILADAYWQTGDGRQAGVELKIISLQAPASADRFYRLGLLAGQFGRDKEAVLSLTKAVKMSPKSLTFHVELAKALAKIKEYDPAIVELDEAIKLLPANDLYAAVLFAETGDIFSQKGDVEKAKEAYRRGLAIEPGNAYLQAQLAKVGG